MSQNKYLKLAILGTLLILVFSSIYFAVTRNQVSNQTNQNTHTGNLTIGSKRLSVEVMRTPEELRQGLSGRDNLAQNSGMYFEMGKTSPASFWMKDMKFPIDIIWIKDGVIVGVEKSAPLPTADQIPTFNSPGEITNVLEVNAGFFNQNNLQIGDQVRLN